MSVPTKKQAHSVAEKSKASGKLPTSPSSVHNSNKGVKKGSKLQGLVKSGWSSVRKGKSSKKSKSSSSSTLGDASSTIAASIAIDDKTANTFVVSDGNSTYSTGSGLDLVVLLMDPVSHRFELLQLEFDDATKAKVSDLLIQIPLSVTEPCLKKIAYDSILDENYYQSSPELRGNDLAPSAKLIEIFDLRASSYAKENGSTKMVLVARPSGTSDVETLRLAKPIFTNKDVATMLELSGFDVSGWKSKKFPPRQSNVNDISNQVQVDKVNENNSVANSSTSYVLLALVFAMVIGALTQSIMIKSITPDTLIKPGTLKSKCGLFGFLPVSPFLKHRTKELLVTYVSEEVVPSFLSCDDEFLKVNYDGTATLYDAHGEIAMVFQGTLCSENTKVKEGEKCSDGLYLNGGDNTLEMGRKRIKQVAVRKSHKNKRLSPWPFEREPAKLGYKIVSSKGFN